MIWVVRFLLLSALGLTFLRTEANAEDKTLLINVSDTLNNAISLALRPWNIDTENITERTISTESMPGARDQAHRLAQAYKARAIIWISSNEDGPALWVYDSHDDRIVVRRLASSPPYDEVSAASVALTIKTLLMHSQVAPKPERFGAKVSPDVVLPPKTLSSQAWALESQLFARHSATNDSSYQTRIGIGVTHRHKPFEVGARINFGSGRTVNASEFNGQFSDVGIGVQLRYPISLPRNWSAAPIVSANAHWSMLDGTLHSQTIAASRLNPSLGLGLRIAHQFQTLQVGAEIHTVGYLRSQNYLANGNPVLDLPTFQAMAGLYFAVGTP